jgi:DNA-binding response OmpR family regulator
MLRVGNLVLDPATHEVRRSGAAVALPRTEFVILEVLMRNAGRVITRPRLIEAVWGHDRDVQNNTLDVFIRQLRSKIEVPENPRLLHTVRGIGYTMREEGGA